MPTRDQIEIDVDAGEDFAFQLIWGDDAGDPVPVAAPCRADVRDANSELVMQFKTGNNPATQATINIASSVGGVLQFSAPRAVTRAIEPGMYAMDIFATVANVLAPIADPQIKLLSAQLVVYPRQTIMEA